MNCDAQTLMSLAGGLQSIPNGMKGAVQVSLYCGLTSGIAPLVIATNSIDNSLGKTSYGTDSAYQPRPNSLVLAIVENYLSTGGAVLPTFSGNGLTWVQVATQLFTIGNKLRITVFRAMGSAPTSTTSIADFGATAQTACGIRIVEVLGVDTSGTNGSGAVVQSATNSSVGTSDPGSVTLGLPVNANGNDTVMGFLSIANHYPANCTPDVGWSVLYDGGYGFYAGSFCSYENHSVTNVWHATTGVSTSWGAIALEIKPQ